MNDDTQNISSLINVGFGRLQVHGYTDITVMTYVIAVLWLL